MAVSGFVGIRTLRRPKEREISLFSLHTIFSSALFPTRIVLRFLPIFFEREKFELPTVTVLPFSATSFAGIRLLSLSLNSSSGATNWDLFSSYPEITVPQVLSFVL